MRAYEYLMIDPDVGNALSDKWEGPFITHLITMLQQCSTSEHYNLSQAESISGDPWPLPEADPAAWKRKWCSWVNTELRMFIALKLRVTVAKSSKAMLARVARVKPSELAGQQWQSTCAADSFTDLAVWHHFAIDHNKKNEWMPALVAPPANT